MIAPGIDVLARELDQAGMHVTIETAGTVYKAVVCDLMSISPKLKNSTPDGEWAARHDQLRIQPDALTRLMRLCDYQLKFVVSRPEDLEEIREVISNVAADRKKVILMPEGTNPAKLREKALWLAELCKREGFRFGPRLHIDIWGDRRGV